jgi:hypothetical protein
MLNTKIEGYTIGELTTGQVRRYVTPDPSQPDEGWGRTCDMVAAALNNGAEVDAAGGVATSTPWTRERVESLPWRIYRKIEQSALKLSGLGNTEPSSGGEAAAPLSTAVQ